MSSFALLLLAAAAVVPWASAQVQLNAMTYLGCYSSSNGLSFVNTDGFQTDGLCQNTCVADQKSAPVLGLTAGNACYCGSQIPPTNAKVDDSKCSTGCFGFGAHKCGGTGFFTVYLTGTQAQSSVSIAGSSSSSSNTNGQASSSTTAAPSVITSVTPGQTIVVTQSAAPTSTAGTAQAGHAASSGKSNAGAIAGGVVGVVLALVAVGALVFFLRHRRRRAAEEEFRNNQANFAAGGRPTIPAMKGPMGPDSRLDAEAMAHRRLSDGSIADNQDYSRRILKVTNPDDRR